MKTYSLFQISLDKRKRKVYPNEYKISFKKVGFSNNPKYFESEIGNPLSPITNKNLNNFLIIN